MASLARYAEHLSEADYAVLESVVRSNSTFARLGISRIKDDPELLDYLLSSDDVYEALFDPHGRPLVNVSPFLGFAVLVHRSAVSITATKFVTEWVGPRKRVPLLDTTKAREVLQDPEGRIFLAELLASFTHVTSGVIVSGSRGGPLTRRRFSELDLSSLVELADSATEETRAHVVKRIGDLALLLAGVFPDYAGSMLERSVRFRGAVARALARTGAQVRGAELDPDDLRYYRAEGSALRVLDELASASYSYLLRSTMEGTAGVSRSFVMVANDAESARRALNFVADRYLFEYRSSWFGVPN